MIETFPTRTESGGRRVQKNIYVHLRETGTGREIFVKMRLSVLIISFIGSARSISIQTAYIY